MKLRSKPVPGQVIGREGDNGTVSSEALQLYLDEIEQRLNMDVLGAALKLQSYAVADLPDASEWEGSAVYVSDETGGAVLAFSDGTDWRRTTDRAVVA